jgi:hypothetical protein
MILTGALPIVADRPFEQSGGWIATVGIATAIVTTGLLAFGGGLGRARKRGEHWPWLSRVLATAAILIVGLPMSFIAGAVAGLDGFSCYGGKIGEGCGGGSLLTGLLVGGLLAALVVVLAFLVAIPRNRQQ